MNADRLLAHYEKITEAPDAITRLRRFILDLAVRGKLVPQDAKDDSACELLQRIARERAGLGLKHTVSPLRPDELPFDLPSGWSWSCIVELCTKTGSGSTPRGGKEVYKDTGIPFLRSQNVYDDGLRLSDVAYIDTDTHARMGGTKVLPGDLLLNITGGSMGRCCRIADDFGEANVSQHVAIIRPAVRGIENFLHRLVLSPYFQAFIFDEQTGAGRGGLPKNRMDRIAVALPPLAEQHRIVAKVDELMGLCDRLEAARAGCEATRDKLTVASLARLNAPDPETFEADARFALDALPALTRRPDQIKALRQTILNLAVRGKLVPQDEADEPASELLERIEKEKVRLVKAGILRKQEAFDLENDGQDMFDVPKSWRWVPATYPAYAISDMDKKIQTKDVLATGLYPVVDQGKVFIRGYCNDPSKVIRVEFPLILFGDHTRETKLIDFDFVVGADGVKLLQPVGVFTNYYFLALQWLPLDSRGYGRHFKLLRASRIPIPPLAEQHRIVAKVDELMALCDRLEASLATAASTRRRLLDALLAEALTPADARELEAAE